MNMRYFLRSLFLACVCLSVLFLDLHTVYATENDTEYYDIEIDDSNISTLDLFDDDLYVGNIAIDYDWAVNGSWREFIDDGSYSDGYTSSSYVAHNFKYFNSTTHFKDAIKFYTLDNSIIIKKGSNVDFKVTNVQMNWEDSDGGYVYGLTKYNSVQLYFMKKDGSVQSYTPTDFALKRSSSFNYPHYDIFVSYENVPFDCVGFYFVINSDTSCLSSPFTSFLGQDKAVNYNGGFNDTVLTLEVEEPDINTGLLNNIISAITSIPTNIANSVKSFFDNIVSAVTNLPNALKGFFDNIVTSITNMVSALKDKLAEVISSITSKLQAVLDGIKNALTTLGNFLIDGIKGLFVPSEEDITNMKDNWENLLATRFGALYEVVQLCIDYANSFNSTASVSVASGGTSTITIPVVSVPLGDVSFEFGGWEVDIVPSGFEFLIDSIKLMFSVCATILFVNGLRNKFEKVVSK